MQREGGNAVDGAKPEEGQTGKKLALARGLTLVRSIQEDYPWKVVGFLAFLVGCCALYGYLVSISYVPPDLLQLMALGSIAALWLFLIWTSMTILLFGTAAWIAAYEVKELNWKTIFIGQLGPLLLLIAWVFRSFEWWALPTVFGAAAFMAAGYRLWTEEPRRRGIDFFMAGAALLLGSTFVPIGTFMAVGTSGVFHDPKADWLDVRLLAFPLVLSVLVGANAAVGSARGRKNAFIAWGASLVATATIFLAFAGPAYVGSLLAVRVGIRLPGTVLLSVSKEACTDIVALTEMSPPHFPMSVPTICSGGRNLLRGEVQLRWGGRWLLVVASINGVDVPVGFPRVTIPDAGTQLILHTASSK